MRVMLTGGHPWSGHTGEVIDMADETNGSLPTNTMKVRLRNGQQVLVFAGQWKRVTRVG